MKNNLMNPIFLKIVLFLSLAGALCACGGNSGNDRIAVASIARADSIMDSVPEAALRILSGLDTLSPVSDKARARLTLSTERAKDKCRIKETDDSLISEAVSLFRRCGMEEEEMWSHFYKGVILFNANDFPSAVNESLEALRIARSRDDHFAKGKAFDLMAEIYYRSLNTKESIPLLDSAVNSYSKAGKDNFARYTSISLATAHTALGETAMTHKILDSLENVVTSEKDIFYVYICNNRMLCLTNEGKLNEALDEFRKARKLAGDDVWRVINPSRVGETFLMAGKPDSARRYLAEAEKLPGRISSSPLYHTVMSECLETSGDLRGALRELRIAYSISDSMDLKFMGGNLSSVERAYNDAIHAKNSERISSLVKTLIWVVLAAVILLLVGLFFWLRGRRRIRKAEDAMQTMTELYDATVAEREFLKKERDEIKNELECVSEEKQELYDATVAERESLKKECSEAKNELECISGLKQEIDRLFKAHFDILYNLCEEFLSDGKASKRVMNYFENEIKKIRSKSFTDELIRVVNRNHGNVLSRLQKALPGVTYQYVVVVAYFMAGFKARAVALFLDMQVANYYNVLSRLKARLKKSDAPDCEDIMRAIFNEKGFSAPD